MIARRIQSLSAAPLLLALLCVFISGALAPAAGRAAQAPEQWLERMNEALVERNYRGEFSYYSDGDLSSLRLIHAVIDGVQNERLVHLNGQAREILRTGDVVHCVYEHGDEIAGLGDSIPSGPFARSFSSGASALSDAYRAEVLGAGRVAGRAARRIDVVPTDGSRYGYRLWLDEATGMLLRSELLDPDGALLEIFQFVSIEMDARIEPEELQAADAEDRVWKRLAFGDERAARSSSAEIGTEIGSEAGLRDGAGASSPVSGGRWQVGWRPPGFTLTTADLRHLPSGNRSVRTLRYTDGMANFSVFVERTWSDGSWQQQLRRGATTAVMRELQLPGGERYLVTVVGEVPMVTAERIAQSVELAGAGAG